MHMEGTSYISNRSKISKIINVVIIKHVAFNNSLDNLFQNCLQILKEDSQILKLYSVLLATFLVTFIKTCIKISSPISITDFFPATSKISLFLSKFPNIT